MKSDCSYAIAHFTRCQQRIIEIALQIPGIPGTEPKSVALLDGNKKMQIMYNAKTDLLYLRLDDRNHQVVNKRVSDDVVLDVAENDQLVGIEILDASKHLTLEKIFPIEYRVSREAV